MLALPTAISLVEFLWMACDGKSVKPSFLAIAGVLRGDECFGDLRLAPGHVRSRAGTDSMFFSGFGIPVRGRKGKFTS